ncbi:MAG: DUF86 domain-containing protein [Candidatus Altiarchaeota archaeon]|nr:DUF86 domain-containing protein [Candidatus Altiarchaeota archaeon]
MDIKEKIHRKLKLMEEYIKFLESYKTIDGEELEANYELRSAIERNFQVALEAVFDIGESIISHENLKKPESYREIIEILGDNGILSKEFANKFAPAAGFRNILVHMYAEVDVNELYEYLHNNLDDFDKFARYIAEYLEK